MPEKFTSSRLTFIRHYYGRIGKMLGLLAVFIPLAMVLEQLVPWYMAKLVDLINGNTAPEKVWHEVLIYFALVAWLSSILPIVEYITMLLLQYRAISPISLGIRGDLFDILLKREPHFFKQHTAGDLMTKIEQCRRSIAAYSSLGDFCFGIYRPICGVIVILVLLTRISPIFAVLTMICMTLCFGLFYFTAQTAKQTANEAEQKYAELFGHTVGKINHYFLIKIFGTAMQEKQNLAREIDALNKIANKDVWLRKRNKAVLGLCSLLFFCTLMTTAVYLWVERQITVGDVVYIFTVVGGSLLGTLQAMFDTFAGMMYRLSLLQRNLELFNESLQIADIENARFLRGKIKEIEIKNLSFAYENSQPVLHKLNLKIKAGEKVGLVGVSGGGKTTLIHLLQRLENTPRGCIFINGRDITELPQENLHKLMSFIPQDTSLFHRTMAENMSYGTFGAAQKQIKRAAHIAYLDKFIESLPQRYETLVGDKGIKLSGGQRQRVAIARAVLKNAPILLLDEATSALDSESETYIQKALQKLIKDKTVIAAAHRLSTLKNMDRIVVIENGRIIEDDAPENLLKNAGKFSALWQIQMNVEK
ncbi:MAG: ABC transporter ATP-binding protein [Alphaproteobacteria bacterium]|nr:ABC transporter ATP-binding protein [Alphaproteobacteria bacterium]